MHPYVINFMIVSALPILMTNNIQYKSANAVCLLVLYPEKPLLVNILN